MTYSFIIIYPEQAEHLIDKQELNEVFRLLKQLFKNYNKTNPARKFELISSNSNILIIKTENSDMGVAVEELYVQENYKYFQKFIAMLRNDLSHTRKVIDYSKKIGITTRKLSAICQSYKGKS